MALPSRMVILVSSDGENFEVEKEVAKMSQTLEHLIEDVRDPYVIPLPNVTSKILSMVLEYCQKHFNAPSEKLKDWDADFADLDQDTLFELMLAASYLNIKSLLDLTCQTVAGMMKGKTPEEIRETFNIKNDYTPEEEEDIRNENSWAFKDMEASN